MTRKVCWSRFGGTVPYGPRRHCLNRQKSREVQSHLPLDVEVSAAPLARGLADKLTRTHSGIMGVAGKVELDEGIRDQEVPAGVVFRKEPPGLIHEPAR
jgi:hypothetical protein